MLHRLLLTAILAAAGVAFGGGGAAAADVSCGTDCLSPFGTLRHDIGVFTPAASAQSLLAKVDVAERLLFPANVAHPPSLCASAHVLTALGHEVEAQSLFSPVAAATIQTDITDLLASPLYHPPAPIRCEPGGTL